MLMKSKPEELIRIAIRLAKKHVQLFAEEADGPGVGNTLVNDYINELKAFAKKKFQGDFAERSVMGGTNLRFDYYFPKEKTVIEIALSLHNSNTEFEKDLLKCLLARTQGMLVKELWFFTRTQGVESLDRPARRAFIDYVEKIHSLKIKIFSLNDGN